MVKNKQYFRNGGDNMYKILVKYSSSFGRDYYHIHTVRADESDEEIEFSTDDVEELKNVVAELDKIYGSDSIRVIKDITYTVDIGITES